MLKRLNQIEQFEFTFPFYRMRIDQYEGRVKRFVNKEDENTLSLRQLLYSLEDDTPWQDLQDETSVIYRLMNEPELREPDKP